MINRLAPSRAFFILFARLLSQLVRRPSENSRAQSSASFFSHSSFQAAPWKGCADFPSHSGSRAENEGTGSERKRTTRDFTLGGCAHPFDVLGNVLLATAPLPGDTMEDARKQWGRAAASGRRGARRDVKFCFKSKPICPECKGHWA